MTATKATNANARRKLMCRILLLGEPTQMNEVPVVQTQVFSRVRRSATFCDIRGRNRPRTAEGQLSIRTRMAAGCRGIPATCSVQRSRPGDAKSAGGVMRRLRSAKGVEADQ